MGLRFSHTDAAWSYLGWNDFRRKITEHLGFDWIKITGYCGLCDIPPDEDEKSRLLATKDPIISLLMHSDCSGTISAKKCKKIALRLQEIISDWEDNFHKKQALLLIDGMRLYAEKNESLIFK